MNSEETRAQISALAARLQELASKRRVRSKMLELLGDIPLNEKAQAILNEIDEIIANDRQEIIEMLENLPPEVKADIDNRRRKLPNWKDVFDEE